MENNENKEIKNTKEFISMALYLGIPTVIAVGIISLFIMNVNSTEIEFYGTTFNSTAILVLSIIGAVVLYFILLRMIKRLIAAYVNRKNIKVSAKAYSIILIILVIAVIAGYTLLAPHSSSGRGGDGKTTCLNCGRRASLTIGYCDTCYGGFSDWYDKTYIDGK